jgi:hypothetical protein
MERGDEANEWRPGGEVCTYPILLICQGVLLWLRFGWTWRHESEDGILTPWVFSLSRYLSILGRLEGHAGSCWREVMGLRRLWAGFLRWGGGPEEGIFIQLARCSWYHQHCRRPPVPSCSPPPAASLSPAPPPPASSPPSPDR